MSKMTERSETQHLLRSIPLSSNNLLRLKDAAQRDLLWFTTNGIASSVSVVVTVPTLNTVKFAIAIEANGEETSFEFTQNWKATL
jgi:phage gp46-like protein